ncbi:hypothetical protein LBBP_02034 [Leptospira borgpetersenii serovar Ballum]|uniref:Uncharacterized protein n=1 Tax=Leptospira borgpetersenii serovar Ballum TaxID=280505 RepID=A0A0S2IRM1_LEPBO|nr:hypothetical protein LBBP_02034 [Leptospira borgpetersenii serovar Ballum]
MWRRTGKRFFENRLARFYSIDWGNFISYRCKDLREGFLIQGQRAIIFSDFDLSV